jgi:hypothetical protein
MKMKEMHEKFLNDKAESDRQQKQKEDAIEEKERQLVIIKYIYINIIVN